MQLQIENLKLACRDSILVQRSDQLSSQANWEVVIKLVRNIPGKDEDEMTNMWLSFELRNQEIQRRLSQLNTQFMQSVAGC